MPSKAPAPKAPASKAPGFMAQVTAPLVSAVASSAMGGGAAKSQSSTKASGSRAGLSVTNEVPLEARDPLVAALQAIGGPDVVSSASNLMIVTTKFPKTTDKVPGWENQYVTGLQGNVTKAVNNTFKGQKIQLEPGDLFRIRWDSDPGNPPDPKKGIDQQAGKGQHINAEFFGKRQTTKIAFMVNVRGANAPGFRNSDEYDMTVRDYSTWLDYQTKPNIDFTKPGHPPHVYTMEERTGVPNATQALKDMAVKLAGRWSDIYANAPKES